MVWIVLGFLGLAAVLLFFGAVKLQRLEERYPDDDDGVTLLEEDDDADGK